MWLNDVDVDFGLIASLPSFSTLSIDLESVVVSISCPNDLDAVECHIGPLTPYTSSCSHVELFSSASVYGRCSGSDRTPQEVIKAYEVNGA